MIKKIKISVIIPVYNEEKNLVRLFNSLKRESFSKNEIEFIVVNDNSNDKTKSISKKFGAKVLDVKTHDIELNKGIGLYKSRGEYIYFMDADMEVCSTDFFTKLVEPLEENKNFIASFTKEFALDCGKNPESSLLRFISFDPLQRDPLYQFFSPSIESTIVDKKDGYFSCIFKSGKIPPAGRCLYRKEYLLKTDVAKNKSFIDLESLEIVSRAGYQDFAYVPDAKIRHYHAESLSMLIKKRLRNLQLDYLPNINKKYYTWFDIKNKKDVLKIFFWVIWANLFIPELLVAAAKYFEYEDIAVFWRPIVAITTTDLILFNFLKSKEGRKIFTKMLSF